MISFIYDIAKQFEFSLEIKVSAREEGRLKSSFKIFWQKNKDKILISTIPSVIAIVLTAFFHNFKSQSLRILNEKNLLLSYKKKLIMAH